MVNSGSKRKIVTIPNATGGKLSILKIEIYGNGKPTILDALKSQRNTSQPEMALENGFLRMKESLEEVKDSIKKLEEEVEYSHREAISANKSKLLRQADELLPKQKRQRNMKQVVVVEEEEDNNNNDDAEENKNELRDPTDGEKEAIRLAFQSIKDKKRGVKSKFNKDWLETLKDLGVTTSITNIKYFARAKTSFLQKDKRKGRKKVFENQHYLEVIAEIDAVTEETGYAPEAAEVENMIIRKFNARTKEMNKDGIVILTIIIQQCG